jgi:alpha-D-xyloside xylohydrolase
MKMRILLLIILIPSLTSGQIYKTSTLLNDRLCLQLNDGILSFVPLSDNAIRVQFEKEGIHEDRELIFVNQPPVPKFTHSENNSKISLSTGKIKLEFDKSTGGIEFSDNTGKAFLSEIPGTRELTRDSVIGEPCFIAAQSFDSPENEYLFGLGQFQDGHFNLRNVSRKLIQVNSQISIPFLYSSRGFGILWHQYGLTEFNPAGNIIPLSRMDISNGENEEADVTTSAGTQKVTRQEALYSGKVSLQQEGNYSLMLDFGNMESRHLLIIDDSMIIDQSNMWLPPAVSATLRLKAGEHSIKVICRSANTPVLKWELTGNTTTFRSPNARSLDYVVFYGINADEVIGAYRDLSGNVPMLPSWAYGFWQCRERYTSSVDLTQTVKEFRRRHIPMDVIVQDWQYWGNNGWGVPEFDETQYPDPAGFIKELHDLNAHFNISIWSNPDKNSPVGKEFVSDSLYIPGTKWLDYFKPETRDEYWNTLNKNLFMQGVDSWWMDATEPENDALAGIQTAWGPGDFYRLTYPLMVSKTVYEGQRSSDSSKRVCILTRSAFAGQQRYGTVNWSGDIGGTWDGFKRQIVAGLNYSLTGMPFWTTDIGGFFRPGPSQYTDENYRELLTRWFQWGAFNPVFRIHGYQTETEPWKYGQLVEDNMREMLNLRYRLLPYIYSEAWQVSKNGSTLMRPLIVDFRDDPTAIKQGFEYLFGSSILVTPVISPGAREWSVYLPESVAWYDFWTGKQYSGGQTVDVPAPLDKIPLFVKAGSIIPLGKFIEYTGQKLADTLEIRLYRGADGRFDLYEDEGDNYNYEKGKYTIIPFSWNEHKQTISIGERVGDFSGKIIERVFNVIVVRDSEGTGISGGTKKLEVHYSGKKKEIRIK